MRANARLDHVIEPRRVAIIANDEVASAIARAEAEIDNWWADDWGSSLIHPRVGETAALSPSWRGSRKDKTCN